jgi:hypothetical protein
MTARDKTASFTVKPYAIDNAPGRRTIPLESPPGAWLATVGHLCYT